MGGVLTASIISSSGTITTAGGVRARAYYY